ncbi:hypothetical protein PESHB4_20420 [Pediococcus ethanolidurans]
MCQKNFKVTTLDVKLFSNQINVTQYLFILILEKVVKIESSFSVVENKNTTFIFECRAYINL